MLRALSSLLRPALAALAVALLAAGCRAVDGTPFVLPGAGALPAPALEIAPAVAEYNLGETTITQSVFPAESGFRDMPVRLNGIIAVPQGEGGPYPVVVIFHGTHPGCPVPEGDMVDRWPCDPALEQRNYLGFAYLVRALAGQGYVALAPNVNAEHTFGFGETLPGERLRQLATLHLQALAAAAAGGPNNFGVDLTGRADLTRLALFGHSRGAEAAYELAHDPEWAAEVSAGGPAVGPVAGLFLIAAAPTFVMPTGADMPLAVILPACDGDVTDQMGQKYYEGVRLNPASTQWALSLWLERANHNHFNEQLPPDPFGLRGRPDCAPLLEPGAQRAVLVDAAGDFLTAIFSADPAAVAAAEARLGMAAAQPAPAALYGAAGRVAGHAPAANRLPLLVPRQEEELAANLAGGTVTAEGITTFFCEEGYSTPWSRPGSEPCKRPNVTIPAHPAMAVLTWSAPGAAWRFSLPAAHGDLRGYSAVSLRAAVDPTSPLNAPGRAQAFSVQLTDRAGQTATVRTRPDEPALTFPLGEVQTDEVFADGLFSAPVPMTTIRLPLADFAGVDLSQVSELTLRFDQAESGALFVGDLEFVR